MNLSSKVRSTVDLDRWILLLNSRVLLQKLQQSISFRITFTLLSNLRPLRGVLRMKGIGGKTRLRVKNLNRIIVETIFVARIGHQLICQRTTRFIPKNRKNFPALLN